jgi:ABC-2 type transport system ATP-binding protein
VARIILKDVSVSFPVMTVKSRSLRANLLYLGSAGALARDARGIVTITALHDVGFEAQTGDRIALVGRNGSGKTTLLKVIAGIYSPTKGSVAIDGRISPILGTGLGVDDDLSGYEAIEYACLLRGIPPARIPALREEIADFTELNDYLYVPVRTYSAGMKMRLGFAVATADQPDVLLIDEGIMAGDIYFMEKARERANQMLRNSNILILASHSEDILRANCNKAILFDSGGIVAAGPVDDVLQLYHRLEEAPRQARRVSAASRTSRTTEAHPTEHPFSSACAQGHVAGDALDGAVRTHWLSDPAQPVCDAAFLGYDFGEGNEAEIRGVTLRQWSTDFAGKGCVAAVALQSSSDGFQRQVRTVETFDVEPTVVRHTLAVAPSAPARYWRLLAKSAPLGGCGWGLIEFDLDTVPPESFQGGRPIGSMPSSPGTRVESAFDDSTLSHWTTQEPQDQIKGTSWIGWDFGPGRKVGVRSFTLRQWDGGALPNTISVVKVQSSSDGFLEDVQTADTVNVCQDTERHVYGVAVSRKARFWRILADSTTNGGRWGVIELRFSEHPVAAR